MGVVFQPARFPVGGTAVHLSGNVATVIWLLGIQDPYGFFFFVGFFSRGGGGGDAAGFISPSNEFGWNKRAFGKHCPTGPFKMAAR